MEKNKSMRIFNQLDFDKKISNLQILEDNIITKNYGENSILIKCFDQEKELIYQICFAKGKNSSLFKIMQGYKQCDSRKSVYNIGIPTNHFFWVWKYDLNSGRLIGKEQIHYSNLVYILEENNKQNILLINKQKNLDLNITGEGLKRIQREYQKYKEMYNQWNQTEKNKYNKFIKKIDQVFENNEKVEELKDIDDYLNDVDEKNTNEFEKIQFDDQIKLNDLMKELGNNFSNKLV